MTLPVLSRERVVELDRRAIEEYGVPGVVLMENAGRGCVDVLCQLGVAGPVVICCGAGNNGGDGFVIARHLQLRGRQAKILLWHPPQKLRGDADVNYQILVKAGFPITHMAGSHDSARLAVELEGAEWIVDALLGTGAQGEPRSPLDAVIAQLNDLPAQRLAVDLPSGLDCSLGQPAVNTFRAHHTCTFVAAKPGLLTPAARPLVGQIHIVDIGAPYPLVQEMLEREEQGRNHEKHA